MGELSLPTRIVVGVLWASFAAVVVILITACWFLFMAMSDPLLFLLIAIVGPALLYGLLTVVGGLPASFRFIVNFSNGEPSAYYGGFIPAVVLFMLSVLFATVGLPASWWVAPALLGAAIVGLLLHPMTRADFARRELAGSDVRAARVFWVDRDPEPNGGS